MKSLASKYNRFIMSNEIRSSHISLLYAILLCQQNQDGKNPFRVTRNELMKLSRIRSFATYHKCLNDLKAAGNICYRPSFDKYKASRIKILDSETPVVKKNSP